MIRAGTRVALAVVLLTAIAGGLRAQNVATTGQIRGTLASADGPVTGAVVTARNTETGLTRSTLSGESGYYIIRLLPPGTYDVRTQVIGFREAAANEVQVAIGQGATVNLTLQTEAVALEGIEVIAERAEVDVSDASVVDYVGVEQIEELPSLGRDFTDFINLSGLVAPDPGETTGGQFSIAGQRASQTNLQIDGVDANNAFFGENRGGSRIPFVFSLESIEEFQIITNGYDVEYGSYSGGIVNVVTRSGTNQFDGSAYANLRNEALTATPFLSNVDVADYSVTQFAGRVAGPIIRDRAFFNVSFDAQRRREPQVPITLGQFEPGGDDEDPARVAQIERFFSVLDTIYGVNNPAGGYSSFQTTNDVLSLFGRVDWNLNDQHRLSVRHNFATYTNDNEFAEGFDFIYGQSRAETIEDDSHSFVTELQSVFDNETFNVFRFQYATEERPRQGSDIRPSLVVNLGGGQSIGYGGTFVGFNNNLEESKVQVIDNFTKVFGSHTVKLGANAIFTDLVNSFLGPLSAPCGIGSQGGGVYCFPSLDAFEAGLPNSYSFNVWTGGLVPLSEFSVTEVGIYAQDEWQVTPRLNVIAGLRHDRQSFNEDPGRVVDVERAFGFPTGTAPVDDNNISPRLSLAWDFRGDGRSVVRTGAGYFFGRVPYVIGGNVIGSQRPVFQLSCTGSIIDGDPDAPVDPRDFGDWNPGTGADNPRGCRSTAQLSGVPSYTVWNPDFEYPETFKGNVGVEQMVGSNSRVSLDLIYTRSTKLYTVRNLNVRTPQFVIEEEDDRRIFTPAAVFNPSGGNTANSRLNTNFGDVYVNYNDGVAESFVASLEGNYRLGTGARLTGSYTFTRAYDNSNYSCCTANEGYTSTDIGALGPNALGGFGAEDGAWGPSDFGRRHTVILAGFTDLPFGFQLGAFWRLQSGRPYTPEISGDINGDGVSFNDRPFIYAPADLPVAPELSVTAADSVRALYSGLLADESCLGDHVGQIIPRNTCTTPWTNLLDMRLTKVIGLPRDQRAELQIDLFNVLNGVGRLFCSEDDFEDDPSAGTCGWGRVTTVSGSDRNLFFLPGSGNTQFDGDRIYYDVSRNFGRERVIGDNLHLQFQAQIGLKYYF